MAKKKPVNKPTVIKNKGGATFIQLNREYIAPITKVEDNYDYIRYGTNNAYPDLLTNLLSSSGLHRAIIEKKVSMTMGKGLNIDVIDDKTLDFILHPNPYEDLNSLIEKCDYDLETYGGYYLQIIQNPNTKLIEQVYHMDFNRMRVGNPNEFGFSDEVYFFSDLTQDVSASSTIDQAIQFPLFNSNNDMSEPQIIQSKKYAVTNKYYGAPIYEAAVLDIQTYSEISNFHNSNLANNFSPGFMIFFHGTPPSEDLQDAIVGEMKIKYAGSEQTGAPMVFFLEEDMAEPLVKPVEVSDLDKQFQELIKQLVSNIAISHQIPRQVVGIETAGSLGSSKELLQATELFRTSYIIPQQQVLLSTFNMIGMINGLDEFMLVNPNPSILMYDMKDLILILTKNELRDWLGYEEIEEEEMDEIEGDDKDISKDEDIKNNEEIDE